MNQTIHIFKKDLRRFSWEIAASLILLAIYAWCQPAAWLPPETFFANGGGAAQWRYLGSTFAGLILVLTWMMILVRLVQEESPAGDRQFWVTRPYRWSSLLAAKTLFLIAVINVPLLIVQLGLLKAAGFAPFHHLGNLIYINLGLDAFLLPVVALAAISGSRTQLTRVAIVALIFLIGWAALGSWGSTGIGVSFYGDARGNWVEILLLAGVPLAVIVRQYARRKTVQSRWILLGGALTLLLLSAVEPKDTLNEAEYPLLSAGTGTYFQTYMGPAPQAEKNRAISLNALGKKGRYVLIDLSLYGGDVAEGQLVQAIAVNVTLRAPDGTQWNSGWKTVYAIVEHQEGEAQAPSQRDWRKLSTLLEVDKDFFDRYKDVPASVHVETAATLFRDKSLPITRPGDELMLPGIGFCVPAGRPFAIYFCRTDLDRLPLIGITNRLLKSCPPDEDELRRQPVQSTAWALGTGGQLGLSPVFNFTPFLQRGYTQDHPPEPCNGNPVIFRQPERVRRLRVQNNFKDVKLADFVHQQ